MKIRLLAIAVAVLAFSAACGTKAFAQATPSRGGTVTDSGRTSNRSGLSDSDRGSFEATESQGQVGRSAADMSKMLRELRGTARQQQSTNTNVQNLNKKRNARSSRQAQQSPPPPIHVHFRPSFSFRRTSSVQVANYMQTRLSHLLKNRDAGSVHIVLSERTAILTGTVKSEYERRLLERMVRIEPGVSAIENRIAIEEPPLAPTP